MVYVIAFSTCALLSGVIWFLFVRWGMSWGSTPEERAAVMPGDALLDGGPRRRMRMTRAITIDAPSEAVWPWLAQLGRGAGWYTYDRLDNGGKKSAEHLVSWIPPIALGDAGAIGYLRYLTEGRATTWWLNGERQAGALMRMVIDTEITAKGATTRMVMRVSGDITGPSGFLLKWIFGFIDSLMARRQLIGFKRRVEHFNVRTEDPARAETGRRDQYQLFEVIYADGERAGVSGKEKAPRWRETAREDGILTD